MNSVDQTDIQSGLNRWIRLHPDYLQGMRRVLSILFALMLVQLMAWATLATQDFIGIPTYLPLHGLMETVSILIAMMVFAVGWNRRSDDTTGHTSLLAVGFLAVACLDFSHTFAYTGMPDYFTPNGSDKHLSFWLAARLFAALTLLALMLPWKLKAASTKYFIWAGVLALVAAIHWVVLVHQQALPQLFIPGKGLTTLKIALEYLCIALNVVTALLLLRRMKSRQPYDAPLLFAAVCVMAMSEFYFTLYTTMTGVYNVLGHGYKVIGYLFIYRAIVVHTIERPYHELEEAQEKLKTAVQASNTGLWEWNFHTSQISLSPVWMAQLGYEHNELPHTFETWVDLLHPDDRDAAIKHAQETISDSTVARFEYEYRMRHKNGKYHWILARGEKLCDASGQMCRLVGAHLDVTERKRAEEHFRIAVEAAPTGMIMVDSKRRIVLTNARADQLLGYKSGELVGELLEKLIPIDARSAHENLVHEYLRQPTERTMGSGRTVYAHHRDGRDIRVEIGLTPFEGQDEHYVLASVQDITARLQADQRINDLTYFDTLTNLPNRNLLHERVSSAITVAVRDGCPLALLYLDLDHFKNINDTLGHRVGDQVLQSVGQRLSESLADTDTVSRVGGDEFVIVLPGKGVEASALLATKLQSTLTKPFQVDGHTLVTTSSVGIAIYPEDGLDFETLYQHADTAMNRAKQDGRNGHRFFMPEMQIRSERTLLLENALHRALERDEFFLNYQPQLSMDGSKVIGVEALLRWRHPELGLVSPAEFIPLAEANGLIVGIGNWVLWTAAKQMRAWIDDGLEPMVMAVNLSAVQFRQANLSALVTEVLEQTALEPEYLELELTESVAMNDPVKAIAVMKSLHDLGVHMSIDDFGTGYSSLSYLKQFKVYKIKIDQSFVRDIATDADDRAIVSAIVQMARSMGFRTIAEGVETVEQRDFLLTQWCDEAQGYLFSRPLSADELATFVRKFER